MDILLRQVRIIDPSSPFHHQVTDVFIQNGIISEIGTVSRSSDKELSIPGLCVSPGWVDIFSNFCDPGFEYKETLQTGSKAAASGGFTDVFVLPNTNPVICHKSAVEYIVQSCKNLEINIHPIGAVTKNAEGKELSEMYDMSESGAIAFSDGINAIQSSGLLLKALQYIRPVNKIIIQIPDDKSISGTGLMNEGIISTRLGLPGKASISEELMISRDLELTGYTNSRIHFTGVSAKSSLEIISKARKNGIQVSCSITPAHLIFTDADLQEYDPNLKVNPPFRLAEDRDFLLKGLLNGEIDCIASHHMPQDKDHKMVEFEYAQYGMSSLETAFAVVKLSLPEISEDRLVEIFSLNARKLFNLPDASLVINKPASITLFHPDHKWTFEKTYSKCSNSPFFGKEFRGKALGIINKDRLFLND